MKTLFHRSLIASVVTAVCIAPAAFAKPKKGEQQPAQGLSGAPGNSGKPKKNGKGGRQGPGGPQNVPAQVPQNVPVQVPQNVRGNVNQPARARGPGSGAGQGPGSGAAQGPGSGPVQQPGFGPGQGGTRRPGLNLIIRRPPFPPPPPPPYSNRTSRRNATFADNDVSSVQRALQERGYYRGGVDGESGPGTRGAIVGFREDNGLGSSSRIDQQLLRALGL